MWMNQPQMNDTKTEFVIFVKSNLLGQINLDSISVGGLRVNSSQTVTFLSAILDKKIVFQAKCSIKA